MFHQERFLRQKMNVQQVRDAVAAQLLSEMTENGCISGQTYEFFSKNAEGVFVLSDSFESYRGEAKQAAKKRKKKV
jgi:quinol monooxygenase YgiN